jgi:predicted permease
MTLFLSLLWQLIPLYSFIALGYIAASFLEVDRKSIARLLIYIITPVVLFHGVYQIELNWQNLALPLISFAIATFLAFSYLFLGKIVYKQNSTKNLLAYTAGTGNTGYFGLPLILLLFGEKSFALAVMLMIGINIFETSLGFFLAARGESSAAESFWRVMKLPTIYALLVALVFNYFQFNLSNNIENAIGFFRGAYSLLGMMIIGMGLSAVRLRSIDWTFLSLAFSAKFIAWPLIVVILIWLDSAYFRLYGNNIYQILLTLSIVPLAANSVAIATEFKIHPEKAAFTVVLSTLFAVFYIPFVLGIYLSL